MKQGIEEMLSHLVANDVELTHVETPKVIEGDKGKEYTFTFNAVEKKEPTVPFCDHDCENCDLYDDEDIDIDIDDIPVWGIPDVEYIIFNPPATIVFWTDGTKTVVKCMEGQEFEKYAGFAMACMKKMFGSTSHAKAIMAECDQDELLADNEEVEVKIKEEKECISLDDIIKMVSDAVYNAFKINVVTGGK